MLHSMFCDYILPISIQVEDAFTKFLCEPQQYLLLSQQKRGKWFMNRLSGLVLVLIMIGSLFLTIDIQLATASGTIYIGADVVVEPITGSAQTPTQTPPNQYNETTLTNDQKAIVRMAVNVLGLTGDAGTLPTKVAGDTIDTKKGIKAADLPNDAAAFGESDDGGILIDKTMLEDTTYPDPSLVVDTLEKLVNLEGLEFRNLVELAEKLLHENTHNQQEEIDKSEMSGSDDNLKDCSSDWTELEAHYAELLFKLKLMQKIKGMAPSEKRDQKIGMTELLIDGLLKLIREREEIVDTPGGAVSKKIESGTDAKPKINDVYAAAPTLEDKIEAVSGRKNAATQKRKELGEKMKGKTKESQGALIDPGIGGNVTLPSGEAWITVPSDSLSAPTYIEIHQMNLTGLPAGHSTLSPVYELGPGGTMFNLSSPARLTIRINDSLAIHIANIYRWNVNNPGYWSGRWELITSGRSIDIDNNTISVDIDHFSYYVVIVPEHDVSLTNVTPSKIVVGQGYSLSINVTVANQGDYTENFNVTCYANTTIIDTLTGITLTSGSSTIVTFIWNTSGFAKGNYTISAYATPVPGETDTADNTLSDGTVYVGIPGDINGDGAVNILDCIAASAAFGSTPSDPQWNGFCDLNNDGRINILDLILVASQFGQTIP